MLSSWQKNRYLFGFVFLIAYTAVVYLVLSQKVYFSDSEFWAVTISSFDLFPNGGAWPGAGQMVKPLQHVFIKIASLIPIEGTAYYQVVRLSFALFGIGTVILCAKLYSKIFESKIGAWLFAVALLTCTFWMERGFRIRADVMASFINILALTYFIGQFQKNKSDEKTTKVAVGLALIEIAMILCTFKAVFLLVAQNLFFWMIGRFADQDQRKWVNGVLKKKFLAEISIGLSIILAIFFAGQGPVIAKTFDILLNYYLETFRQTPKAPSYLSLTSFMHIRKFMVQNPVIAFSYSSLFLVFIFNVLRGRAAHLKVHLLQNMFFLYVMILSILVALYHEKYAYYIAALSPAFVMVGVRGFELFVAHLKNRFVKFNVPLGMCLLVVAVGFVGKGIWYSTWLIKYKNNNAQFQTIQNISQFMDEHGLQSYYDVIGILPRRNPVIAYIGPNQPKANQEALVGLMGRSPDLILVTDRVFYVGEQFSKWVKENYDSRGHGLYIHKKLQRLKDVELGFELPAHTRHIFAYDVRGPLKKW